MSVMLTCMEGNMVSIFKSRIPLHEQSRKQKDDPDLQYVMMQMGLCRVSGTDLFPDCVHQGVQIKVLQVCQHAIHNEQARSCRSHRAD